MLRLYVQDSEGTIEVHYWGADYYSWVEKLRSLGYHVFAVVREV